MHTDSDRTSYSHLQQTRIDTKAPMNTTFEVFVFNTPPANFLQYTDVSANAFPPMAQSTQALNDINFCRYINVGWWYSCFSYEWVFYADAEGRELVNGKTKFGTQYNNPYPKDLKTVLPFTYNAADQINDPTIPWSYREAGSYRVTLRVYRQRVFAKAVLHDAPAS